VKTPKFQNKKNPNLSFIFQTEKNSLQPLVYIPTKKLPLTLSDEKVGKFLLLRDTPPKLPFATDKTKLRGNPNFNCPPWFLFVNHKIRV
jgi:hypothetical protein